SALRRARAAGRAKRRLHQFSADRGPRGRLAGGYRGPRSAALREPHRQPAVYNTRLLPGDGHSAEARTRGGGERRRGGAIRGGWVSESFAKRYWPGQNAIGGSFQIAFGTRTVVGVAGNVRVRGVESLSEPQVYLSSGQMRDRYVVWYAPKDLAVRTTVNPTSL